MLTLFLMLQAADELRAQKPLEPAEALKTFRLAPGYRIELVAAEPRVVDPVDLAFDENGRLFVAEMIDYPYGDAEGNPPQGRIRLLEDVDGDGRYERSTVYADRLRWPTAVACWDGGVLVASVMPPPFRARPSWAVDPETTTPGGPPEPPARRWRRARTDRAGDVDARSRRSRGLPR